MSDRFILWSDLHIHPHGNQWLRVDDALEVLDWIFDQAQERKINKLFFLGDWFHTHNYLYPEIVAKSYDKLLKFKNAGMEMILLVGNHDMPYKTTTRDNSLTAFKSVFPIIDQPYIYEGENTDFYLLPYVANPKQLLWATEKMLEQGVSERLPLPHDTSSKSKILLAHLDVNDALQSTMRKCEEGVDAEKLIDKFDKIITGHYHINQTIKDKIYYVGSPYQQSFNEANQRKGFYIFDDGELEYVENDFSPKYLYVNGDGDLNKYKKIVENGYVRVKLETPDNAVSVREQLKKFNTRSISIQVNQKEVKQRTKLETSARDVKKLLQEWVDKKADTSYDKKKLMEMALKIVSETNV